MNDKTETQKVDVLAERQLFEAEAVRLGLSVRAVRDSWQLWLAARAISEKEMADAREGLRDAIEWIGVMRCDDETTHPRLKILRAALARVGGAA